MVQIWHFKLYNKLSTVQLKSYQRKSDGEITGKNGKPLYGAAREAVLRKLDAEFWQRQEEQEIML